MKVLNLGCGNGHVFEGWFASDDELADQLARGLVECPLCADKAISRLPSAPRLNLSGAREPQVDGAPRQAVAQPAPGSLPPDVQAAWLRVVNHLVQNTDDVGDRFAEEARRIHYGEQPARGIRGQVTSEERQALQEEGIETFSVPLPAALKGPVQ
jgi:hypothetical protein